MELEEIKPETIIVHDKKGNTFLNFTKLQIILISLATFIGAYVGGVRGIRAMLSPIIQDEITLASDKMKIYVEESHRKFVLKTEFDKEMAVKDQKWVEQDKTNIRIEATLLRLESNQLEILKRISR